MRIAWFEDIINYDNLTSNSRVRTTQAQAEHTFSFSARASLRLGGEAQHFAANVDGYPARGGKDYPASGCCATTPCPACSSRPICAKPSLQAAAHPWPRRWGPSAAPRRSTSGSGAPATNLRPENGFGYEAGLRHQLTKNASWSLQTD